MSQVSDAERKRIDAATRIMKDFNELNPTDKREFCDESLTALVNMNKKKLTKMFSKLFFKKGQPTVQDLETINQLIAVFLYSVKDEFSFHYASMIYKAFKMPLPANILEKLDEVRALEWLHIGVPKETYDKLYAAWKGQGFCDYGKFFEGLLRNAYGETKSTA